MVQGREYEKKPYTANLTHLCNFSLRLMMLICPSNHEAAIIYCICSI